MPSQENQTIPNAATAWAALVAPLLLLLSACASTAPPASPRPPAAAAVVQVADSHSVQTSAALSPIGVASCDAYLERYSACHRVTGVYPAAEIDGRYRDLRDSLLRDRAAGADAAALDARCDSLADLMALKLGARICNSHPVASRQTKAANR